MLGPAGDPQVARALWAAKLVLYLGLIIGTGGAVFGAWLARAPAAEWSIVAALLGGLLATPLTVGLQGLDALDLPLSALAVRATWEAGLATAYGATAIVAAFALFAGLFATSDQKEGMAAFLAKRAAKFEAK